MVRVLLADDHPVLREGIRTVLETNEAIKVVGVAANGREALHLIQDLNPDVVVLDIDMPIMTGIEVVRHLRGQGDLRPILILSAYSDAVYVKRIMELGVSGYLLKVEAPQQIMTAILAVAKGEKGWFSPAIVQTVLVQHKPIEKPSLLSEREAQVLRLAAEGLTNKKIANNLCISEHTVKNHFTNIHQKIGTTSHAEAISWAWKNGFHSV